MKKILWIILGVILAAVLVFCLWYFTRLSSVSALSVLPPKPLIYLKVSDTQKYWEQFQSSPFGTEILKINLKPLMRKDDGLNAFFHSVKTLQDQLSSPEVQEYIGKFLGKEVTIAVYPASSERALPIQGMENIIKQGFPEIFWVSRVPADIKLKELALKIYSQNKSSEELGLDKISYRGYLIYLLPVSDTAMTISFVRIGDLVVAALDDQIVRKAIDTYKNVRAPLSKDENFRASLKSIGPADSAVMLYWDTAEVFSMISAWIYGGREPVDSAVSEALNKAQGFTSGGLSLVIDNVIKINNKMYFDQESLSSDMKNYLEGCHPGKNQSLSLTPKDVLLYQSVACLNFKSYWKKVKEEVAKIEQKEAQAGSQDALQKFQKMLGVNIEADLLPVLAGEIGWFANAGVQSVPLIDIKLPQVAVFIKINDLVKAHKLMTLLLAKSPLQMKRDIINGIEVVFMETPLGSAVEPGYIFIGDYVLIGLNRDILKESIYAASDKRVSLISSEFFKRVVKTAEQENLMGIFYFKLSEILEYYSGLVESGYKWVDAQNQAKQEQVQSPSASLVLLDQRIQGLSDELAREEDNFKALEKEVWELDLRGRDSVQKKEALRILEVRLAALRQNLSQVKEQRIEEERRMAAPPKIDRAAVIWRNVLEPVVDGLKNVRALGASSRVLEEHFSTEVLIDAVR